jgi:uncharacterized LabA/DUF88 family protein
MNEPAVKRTIAYIDGQNLFNSVKEAFGYPFPNYDVSKLVAHVCGGQGWQNDAIYFYTGVPDALIDPKRHGFWNAKLATMGTRGIQTFCRPLRYSNQLVSLPNGGITTASVGREKGIDIRLALDIVRDALNNAFDVALVFSQDQDLSEVAQELRAIGKRESRWIKMASAFPSSPTIRNRRGINGTDWITFDRAAYDACIDPTDYRPRQ